MFSLQCVFTNSLDGGRKFKSAENIGLYLYSEFAVIKKKNYISGVEC